MFRDRKRIAWATPANEIGLGEIREELHGLGNSFRFVFMGADSCIVRASKALLLRIPDFPGRRVDVEHNRTTLSHWGQAMKWSSKVRASSGGMLPSRYASAISGSTGQCSGIGRELFHIEILLDATGVERRQETSGRPHVDVPR